VLPFSLIAPVAHDQGGDTVVTPLVFSPARHAQSALEAPSVVPVPTAEQSWRFGYGTLDPDGEAHIQVQLPRDGRTVRATMRWSV
jgi:hypothetical protein